MWSLDPAIRDHVGLAECAWDFNRPDSIPGFGPIGATPSAPSFFYRPAIAEAADTEVPVPSAQAHAVAAAPVNTADPDDPAEIPLQETPPPDPPPRAPHPTAPQTANPPGRETRR